MLRGFVAFLSLFCFSNLKGEEWASKTLQQMTLEEKVGQLLIIPICPLREDDRHQIDVLEALQKYKVGGLIIKQGTLEQEFRTIQKAQEQSKHPLFVVADAEWGLAMRASDAILFPRNMTLGAIRDLSLIEQMGHEIGKQLAALGVHMNLAPVVDVNSNPNNPLIRMRAFGDDSNEVAKRGIRYAQGLQAAGVLGCAKHFPGHGDTAIDSHISLPTIHRSLLELQKTELLPFERMIEKGVSAVMSAHIVVPAVDTFPASLSSRWMTDWLQNRMGFQGLLITDALNMEALAANFSAEEIALRAFMAGHDLFLYGDHIAPRIDDILERLIPTACTVLRQAVLNGQISEAELDRRVLKILAAKKSLGLHLNRTPAEFNREAFHNDPSRQLAKTLYAKAISLVRGEGTPFQNVAVIDTFRQLAERLQQRGITVAHESPRILFACGDLRSESQQLQAQEQLANLAEQGKEIIVIVFGDPYSLPYVSPWAHTLILAYEDVEDAWEAAADLCSGTLQPQGKLPVAIPQLP